MVDDGRGAAAALTAARVPGAGTGLAGMAKNGPRLLAAHPNGWAAPGRRLPGPCIDPGGQMIRVLLADDQPLVRTGIRLILDAEPDIEVVGEAGDGEDAVRQAARLRPDVVLMDVQMPTLDGVEATRRICARARRAGAGSDHLRPRRVRGRRDPGRRERLPAQGRAAGGPADAIRVVHGGAAIVAPPSTRRLLDRFATDCPRPRAPRPTARPAALTDASARCSGSSRAACPTPRSRRNSFVTETTVKTHVGTLLAKLGARDRVQAVVLAYETGLVRRGVLLRSTATAPIRGGRERNQGLRGGLRREPEA